MAFNSGPSSVVLTDKNGYTVEGIFTRAPSSVVLTDSNGFPVTLANGTPTLALDGDSITQGLGTNGGASSRWLKPLLNRSWNIRNVAVPGLKAQNCLDLAATHVDPWLVVGSPYSVCFIWAGTNDLSASLTVDNVWSYLSLYAGHRKGAGWDKVYVTTMISRANLDPQKNLLNDKIRTSWPGVFDGILDLALDDRLGADGAHLNRTYFNADGIHPVTLTQQTIVAPAQAAIVNALTF